MDVQCHRTQRRVSRLLEHDGFVNMCEAEAAEFLGGMRRQQAVVPGFGDQLVAQAL